jgi:hypothetical protein
MIKYCKLFTILLCCLFNNTFSYNYNLKELLYNLININCTLKNITNITNINNSNSSLKNFANTTVLKNTLKLRNDTEVIPPYLKRKTKFCHFKCNCFFSHSVNNDNIYVNNWIRTPGLPFNTMNDNICVTKWIKYI